MDRKELTHGTIFDVQGFSVHDGPGCRTLIFLKGCSLNCNWCSNPEGISLFPEPLWNERKCSYDLACVSACPHHAIKSADGKLEFDRRKCHQCSGHECEKSCLYGALNIGGQSMSIEKLYSQIIRDRQYWGADGGITLTGGEPFLQPKFTHDILKRCFESYIHTAVETCGNVPWEFIEPSLPFLEWIFFDLKQMMPEKYSQIVGRYTDEQNATTFTAHKQILSNATKLAREFKGRLIFRMPLIPGYNDDAENITATISFMHAVGKTEINLLPIHHLGREKYSLLGQTYYTADFSIPTKEYMERIRDQFATAGIHCYTGSDTPF